MPSEPNSLNTHSDEALLGAKGTQGWLLIYVITSYLGCISLAVQIFHSASTSRTLLLVAMFTATLLPAVLVPIRSRLTFAAVWTHLATRMIITAFTLHTIWTLRNSKLYQTREHDLTNQAAAVIISLVWLLYFHYSRRVRETFGENL